MGIAGEAGQKIKKIGATILKIIKKIPTLLGHICFWIIIAIMLVVLLYIIAHILAEGIAKLLGIDSAGIEDTKDYKVLEGLVNSGYNEVMPADELKKYYAYEYAVLMDAARYIEETGVTTIPFEEADGSVFTSLLSKEEWAQLCAASFVAEGQGDFSSAMKNIKSTHNSLATAYNAAVKAGRAAAENGGGENEITAAVKSNFAPNVSGIDVSSIEQKAIDDAISQSNESNEMSKTELVYKSVTDSLTGQTSLVPYLVVARPCYRYKYSFIDKDMSEEETVRDYKTILREGAGQGYGMNETITYTTQNGTPGAHSGSITSWEYIKNNIYPLTANGTLNANNTALHKGDDVAGTSEMLELENAGNYPEGVAYEKKDAESVTYEIPLKTLVDRFMPKAVLLSSWYMLKQDENVNDGEQFTADIIMQQIRDIYDQACLEGEDVPEKNWLLIKDVKATANNYIIPDNITDSVFEITANMDTKTSFNKYAKKLKGSTVAKNQPTDLIYSNYNTNYDCRGISEDPNAGTSSGSGSSNTTSQSIQSSLLAPVEQKFTGTLGDDLINDLELILNHYMDDRNVDFEDRKYRKMVEDFSKQVKDIDESSIQFTDNNEIFNEYIIYKIDGSGNYIIDCEEMKNKTLHHNSGKNGSTHEQKYDHKAGDTACENYIASEHTDPYASGAHVECFIPYIKIAVAYKNAKRVNDDGTEEDVILKSTAAIFIEDNGGYLYRVDEREIEDIAGLTNKETFIKFARADVKMDNIKDWVEENNESNLSDRMYFIVTDLFEARPLKLTGITAGIDVNEKSGVDEVHVYRKSTNKHITTGTTGIESCMGDFDIDITSILDSLKIESYSAGQLGIIRPSISGAVGDYDTLPPNNAAPKDVANGYPSCGLKCGPGESEILNNTYINITKSKDKIPKFLKELKQHLSASTKINSFFNNYYIVITHETDGDVRIDSKNDFDIYFNYVVPSIDENDILGDYVALFTVKRKITTITQDVMERAITMYMPTSATTWSNNIKMNNVIERMGEFDPTCASNEGYFQLIPRTSYNGGIKDLKVGIDKVWRTEFYAQYFANVREADVLSMIAEWEDAADEGIFAANTYIRDLYSLIYYARENAGEVPGLENENGEAYVNKDSYSYFYIPDEIIGFDESITDKAFWMERLLATSAPDNIKPEENLTMKTARNVKTWQKVEYDKYPECAIIDPNTGKPIDYNVYALWPLGGYLGRSLYAFEANVSENANKKIISWGNYIGPGVHSGVDLYCRGNASRIYRVTHKGSEPYITATYNPDGTVTLKSGGSSGATIGNADDEDTLSQYDTAEGSVSGVTGEGAYISGPITIDIEGTEVTFNGTAAAVYGYELYRLTKAYKSGEKAQKVIDEELKKEEVDSPLVAVAPGIVETVKASFRSGFAVKVKHSDGSHTSYVHMKRWPEVQENEYVGAGTILGYEGTTGNSGGYHIHFEITADNVGARYPMQFLYPFFTPFYYQEKVDEMKTAKGTDKILESEYLSIQRTVFPVGEDADGNQQELKYKFPSNQEGIINQVENEDGMVKIQNYVPTTPLCKYSELYKEDNDQVKDFKKLPENTNSLGKVNYEGESVKALPQYFDKAFIASVQANSGHILIDPNNNKVPSVGTIISTPGNGNSSDTENTSKPVDLNNLVSANYKPSDFGMDKPVLSKENNYTDEEWKAMEAVLAERIQNAGFGTRAGVVEAALFLSSLDYAVPYKGTPMDKSHDVGHYDKIGLNNTWGDSSKLKYDIVSYSTGKTLGKKGDGYINGLDCSAFVEWACRNGGNIKSYGVDPGRYGYGGVQNIKKVADKIQPGDFAFTKGENGDYTHIGMVVGVDEENIYVAEELTQCDGKKYNKLTVTKVPKDGSYRRLSNIVLADGKFYPEEANGKNNKGNITYVWGGDTAE